MLLIPIMLGKKQYYITSDSMNFMLSTKKVRTDEKTGEKIDWYAGEWFYGTLKGLFEGIFELKLRHSDAKSMNDLHEEMVKIKKYLMGLIDDHKEDLAIKLKAIYD